MFFSFIKPALRLQPCFPCSTLETLCWQPTTDSTSLFIASPGMTFSEWSWTTLREMRCSTARWARIWTAMAALPASLWRHRLEMALWYGEKHAVGCDLQKRTWESNKNDIRICRMKGKHEVRQLYFVSADHILNYPPYFIHVSCFLCEFMSYYCTAAGRECW